MKIAQIILVAVFLLGTLSVSAQDKKKNNKEETVVFSVSMDCHNCEQKVKKNIPYEKGVKDLTTNLEKQLVTIKYQTNRTDKAKLKKSIEKLGFTCEEVK
jgi:copper chaperone CopZ